MRFHRAFAAAFVAGFLVALPASAVSAHALVKSSDPADGEIVQLSPSQVVITFTEPPDPTLSSIQVLDTTGKQVQSGKSEPVPGNPLQLRVPLGSLPNGVYTVVWRTVSKTDGHVTGGSFAFGVGVSPAGAAVPPSARIERTPPPSPLSVVGKWALYSGLAIMLAGGFVGIVAFANEVPARRVVLIGGWLLAASGFIAMTFAERSNVGVSLGTLLSSGAGRPLLHLGIAVGVAGAAAGVSAFVRGRWPLALVGFASAVVMLIRAQGGHAGAPARFSWFNVRVQWLHMLAAGVWVGGLVLLLLLVWRSTGSERAAQVKRFSTIAGIALALVAATGLLRAVDQFGGWGDWARLFTTGFGVALSIKLVLFAGLVALGAINRYVNVPGLVSGSRGPASLRKSVVVELVIAAGVFGLTGVLTGLPPAATAAQAEAPAKPQAVVVRGSDFATSLRARLVVLPGTVGPNAFQATVTDYDTGRPVEADRVALRFSLPSNPDLGQSTLELTRESDGTWTAQGTQLSIDGDWNVVVVVQGSSNATEVPLKVQTRVPPEQVGVARAPGQPDLYTITLSGGVQIQAYVDPGEPGANELHVTAFDASGIELPLKSVVLDASPPSGSSTALDPRRFGAGHFVADVAIVPGPWTFQIRALAKDGATLDAHFDQTFA